MPIDLRDSAGGSVFSLTEAPVNMNVSNTSDAGFTTIVDINQPCSITLLKGYVNAGYTGTAYFEIIRDGELFHSFSIDGDAQYAREDTIVSEITEKIYCSQSFSVRARKTGFQTVNDSSIILTVNYGKMVNI